MDKTNPIIWTPETARQLAKARRQATEKESLERFNKWFKGEGHKAPRRSEPLTIEEARAILAELRGE